MCSSTTGSPGKRLISGCKHLIDKNGFTVEDIDFGTVDFAVHQQRNPKLLHALQRRIRPFR